MTPMPSFVAGTQSVCFLEKQKQSTFARQPFCVVTQFSGEHDNDALFAVASNTATADVVVVVAAAVVFICKLQMNK